MSIIAKTVSFIRKTEKYSDKSKLLQALLQSLANKKIKASPEDKKALSDFVFEEIDHLIRLIPTVSSYAEKDFLFEYEYRLQSAIMACHRHADELSEDQRRSVELLLDIVNKERFLENMIDDVFAQKKNDPENVKYMLAMTGLAKEEYHKGKFYQGLLHYQKDILRLPGESIELIGEHIRSEMERYLENPLSTDIENNLELICDICRYFGKDRFADLLKKVIWVGNVHIRFYAAASLLAFGCEIPASAVRELANDMEYANLTYSLLKQYRKEQLFPSECTSPEYLAQSKLVRWLTYPSELGKVPDDIEYIGKIRKGGTVYVFRFRSDSENLIGEARGQWLLGWTKKHGGAFSNFDVYSDYKQITADKTLKYIKKKLL